MTIKTLHEVADMVELAKAELKPGDVVMTTQLHGDSRRAWLVKADGHGGLWLESPGATPLCVRQGVHWFDSTTPAETACGAAGKSMSHHEFKRGVITCGACKVKWDEYLAAPRRGY